MDIEGNNRKWGIKMLKRIFDKRKKEKDKKRNTVSRVNNDTIGIVNDSAVNLHRILQIEDEIFESKKTENFTKEEKKEFYIPKVSNYKNEENPTSSLDRETNSFSSDNSSSSYSSSSYSSSSDSSSSSSWD